MIKQRNHNIALAGRGAFTLVEILVVIGIIALLATMLIMAIAPSVENARISATKSIIAQIDQQLQRRMMAFNELNQNLDKEAARIQAGNPGVGKEFIKAVIKKHRYLQEFPQRVQDLNGLLKSGGKWIDGEPAVQVPSQTESPSSFLKIVYSQIKGSDGNHLSGPSSPVQLDILHSSQFDISSSELIYLMLTEGRALGTESYSLDGIPSQYITDKDGDGLMEIRDAWGNELRFYNAPTGLLRPTNGDVNLTQGARVHFSSIPGDDGNATPNSGELYFDPFDKLGRTSEGVNMPISRYYHPNTYFTFLIVSAGPDGDLGLQEPNSTASPAARLATPVSLESLFDNVTNRQQ